MRQRPLRLALLATTSAVGLVAAFQSSAAAQCASQNTAPVTNNAPSNCITLYTPGAYTGNITNNSTLAAPGTYPPGFPGTATGISVLKSGTTLNGNIINSGTGVITASHAGINIGEGATGGSNSNAGANLNGSITNSGTITSADGIFITGSSTLLSTVTGSIINSAGGQITDTDVGINVDFATVGGAITNAGTITGGTGGINVAFATVGSAGTPGSGNIVNATGAHIAATYIGIILNGNTKTVGAGATIAGSIINNGTITAPNQGTAQGIEVAAATVLGGVTNTGTISAAIGIEVFGASNMGVKRIASIAGNIVNQGGINAVSTNGSANGIAIYGFEGAGPAIVGGSITNSGTITVSGVSGTNNGILLAGVHLGGGITNSSTISVGGGGANIGISVAKSSGANFAPPNSSIAGSILNQGTITAGTGILVSGGSIVSSGITDTGTINASIDAVKLTGEGGPTAITISGGTAVVTGNIVGNGLAAGDTLNFQIGANNTFTYNSNFSAISQVNVTSGTVVVNGTANSATAVTVSNGGTLAGTGTIATALTIANGGIWAPGTPGTPGTAMSIGGSVGFGATSTYRIYLNPTTASLSNISGTATLGGATVNAVFSPGSYVSKQYTILTSGGLVGVFNPTIQNTNAPIGVTDSLSYAGGDVFLNVTSTYNSGGLSGNQQSVANALINYFNSHGGIPAAFLGLAPGQLSQIDGEDGTGASTSTFQLVNDLFDLLSDIALGTGGGGGGQNSGGTSRFAAEANSDALPDDVALAYRHALKQSSATPAAPQNFEQRWTAWGSGFGGAATYNGNATVGSNNLNASDYGYAGGMDYHASPDLKLGFALAGGGTKWSLAQNLGGGRSDVFQAAAYGIKHFGPLYFTAMAAFGNSWFTTNRTAALGDQLRASFDGQDYALRGESGYRVAVTPMAGLTPYAAIQTQWLHTPGYSETDLTGGGFGLSYAAQNTNDTRSELGARADDLTMFNTMPLILRARLAWAHDWVSGASLSPTFQALPGASFTVNGAAVPQNSALVSGGGQLFLTANWSVEAKFDGEFASSAQTYAGTGTLRYSW